MASVVAFQWERGVRKAVDRSWWVGGREKVRLSRCIERVVGKRCGQLEKTHDGI